MKSLALQNTIHNLRCCVLESLLVAKVQRREMASGQDRAELDARARQGETVVPGGTGGKSLEAQEHLAEGYIYK